MGVDYMLDCGCAAKTAVGPVELIDLIKKRTRAHVVLQHARREGNPRPPAELVVTNILVTPSGQRRQVQTSIQSLLDETAVLDRISPQCAHAPGNVKGKPFGCYGYISYPFRAATERWVLSLLPDDLTGTAGTLLRSSVRDLHYDGSPLERMRQRTDFFESPEPARRTWTGSPAGGEPFTLTASQVLQMMFCLGALEPSHCRMLALFLGIIPHDFLPDALMDADRVARVMSGRALSAPADDPQAAQFLGFFRALEAAIRLNASLLVDY